MSRSSSSRGPRPGLGDRPPPDPGASLNLTRGRFLALGGVVLVLLIAWLGVRAVQIRSGLTTARAELTAAAGSFSAGRPSEVEQRRAAASSAASRARSAAVDPLWRLASTLPVFGRPFEVAQDGSAAVQLIVDDVLEKAVRGLAVLEERPVLAAGAVDLQVLQELEDLAAEAEPAASQAARLVDGTPDRLIPGFVQRPRDELQAEVRRLAAGVRSARTAVRLARPMLGATEPREYFLVVHNNAETRGTGGLVGAYGVVTADGGRLALESVGTNRQFVSSPEPVIDLGPEFSEHWDWNDARGLWSSAVSTPDWPSASAIMAELWRQQGRGEVDGVIGIDPLVMADVLAVTGPVSVSGIEVTAANVVDFVMRDEYVLFEDAEGERQEVLPELAGRLVERVLAGGYSGADLVQALARSGASGHLQVWSAHAAEQEVLAPLRVSGALPGEPGAFLLVSSYNAAGNKIDYYVRRRVAYSRDGAGGARVTVELTNTVDPEAVPPIVIGRLDDPPYEVVPGQTRQLLSVYVGHGDLVQRVFVDGVEAGARIGTERGHGVASVYVEIRPDRPTVVEVDVTDQGGELVYRQQPLVVDDELDLDVPYRLG